MANYKLPWNYAPDAESLSLIVTPSVRPYLPAIPNYFSGTGSYAIDGISNAVATNWTLSSNITYANGNTAITTDATLHAAVTEFGDYISSIYRTPTNKMLSSNSIECFIAKPTNYILKYRNRARNWPADKQLPKELVFYFPINENISLTKDNFRVALTNFTNSGITDNVTDFSSLVYSVSGDTSTSTGASMSTPPQVSSTDIADAGAIIGTSPYSITCSNVTTKTCTINTNCSLNGFDCFKSAVIQASGLYNYIDIPWHINFRTYDPTAVTTLYDSANRPMSASNNNIIYSNGDSGWYDAWNGASIGNYSDNYGNILRTGYAIFNTGLTNTDIYQDYGITTEQQPASKNTTYRYIYLSMKFNDSSSKQFRVWNDNLFAGNDSVEDSSMGEIIDPQPGHWRIDYYDTFGNLSQWVTIANIYLYNAGDTYTAPDGITYNLTNNCVIIESRKTVNDSYYSFPKFNTSMLKLIMKN